MRHLIFAILFASPVAAESPLTGEEFDQYATGKIIVFGSEGAPDYGVEHYMQNKRVRWSTFDGQCLEGRWYYDAPNICFAYDGFSEPHCWEVFQTPDGLEAKHAVTGQTIFEGREDPSALVCGDLFS